MSAAPFPFDLPRVSVSQDCSLAETFDHVEEAQPPRPAKPCLDLNNAPRQRAPLDYRRINDAALAVLPALLRRWLPDGRRQGHEWLARNPRRADRHAGSFSINTTTGRWSDFATGDRGGDVISLAAFLFNLRQGQAARQLAGMLGIPHHG
jgi:hypothetical protein